MLAPTHPHKTLGLRLISFVSRFGCGWGAVRIPGAGFSNVEPHSIQTWGGALALHPSIHPPIFFSSPNLSRLFHFPLFTTPFSYALLRDFKILEMGPLDLVGSRSATSAKQSNGAHMTEVIRDRTSCNLTSEQHMCWRLCAIRVADVIIDWSMHWATCYVLMVYSM